jgi:hypothetical protein
MEKDTGKFQFRIARDFLMDQVVFPLAATYPMPDIPVVAQNQVVFTDKTGKILLTPFQYDSVYELRDEEQQHTGAEPVADGSTLVLETEILTKDRDDYTYTVTATKNKSGLQKQLLRAVTLRIGVDVTIIPVVQSGVIGFESTADIFLPDTQNGGTYQVFGLDGTTELSKPVTSGEGGDLVITTYTLQEDTPFKVRVMKTKTPSLSDFIVWREGNPEMVVRVYPNDKLTPVLAQNDEGIDYNTAAAISLEGAQESADYQIIYTDIDDDSVDRGTFLGSPSGKSLKGKASGLVLKSDKLKEDPTVVIRATKRESGITRDLQIPVFVPVKPDPDKALSLVQDTVAKGESATIQVNNPQRGIYYQLVDASGKEVGWRDYYHKNYGIGKARVGIELAIGEKPDNTVFLVTGPLDADSTFSVVAKKATTGKTVGLTGSIEIKLT